MQITMRKGLKRIIELLFMVLIVLSMDKSVFAEVPAGYTEIDSGLGTFIKEHNLNLGTEDVLIEVAFQLDNYGNPIVTSVKTESLENFKSLTIDGNNEGTRVNYFGQNLSGLTAFFNLESLTLKGLTLNSISFPSSIKSVTFENCTFNCTPDFSGCTNLEELVLKNNTCSGINLKNSEGGGASSLKKAVFYKGTISSIEFPSSTSGDLKFSAVDCKQLTSVNFGGYRLVNGYDNGNQYAPSFSGCSALTGLTINGLADAASQDFNINGCLALKNFNITYKFTSSDNRLKIKATNITSRDCESVSFARTADSAEGKYSLNAVEHSFLDEYASNSEHASLFDGGQKLSSDASYVVFSQDKELFEKYEEWTTAGESKIRSYEANPIILKVGEQIVDNTPYFYAKDGTLLENYTLSNYEVFKTEGKNVDASGNKDDGQIPTDSELSANGKSKDSYNVITYDDLARALTVTAENPGIAYLTVKTKGGTSVSNTQVIIVLNEVTAASITENTEFLGEETHKFSASFTTKYPSLAKYTDVRPLWKVYKKNGNDYEELSYEATSADGLEIHNVEVSKESTIDTDGTLHKNYEFIVKDTAVGGDYKIGGTVAKYRDACDTRITASGEDKVAVGNLSAGGQYLGYNDIELFYDVKFSFTPSIKFHLTPLNTNDYTVEKPSVSGDEANKCLKIDDLGNGDYELKFNPDASSREIGKFIRSLNKEPIKVTASLGKKGGDTKTFSKDVMLAGKFSLTYDTNGGSLESDNTSKYQIPSWIRNIYNYADVSFNAPTRENYGFNGWYCEEYDETYTSLDDLNGDLNLKATWIPIEYTITYDLQGGVNNSKNPQGYSYDTETFTLLPPTREGYTFEGWNGTNIEDRTKEVTIVKNSKGDLSFKAEWSENPEEPEDPEDPGDTPSTPEDPSDTPSSPDDPGDTPSTPSEPSDTPSRPDDEDDDKKEESSDDKKEESSSSSTSSSSSSSSSSATTPVIISSNQMATVPTYVAPEKQTVMTTVVTTASGDTKEIAVNVNGSVTETVTVSSTAVAALNASQPANVSAPTVISNVSVVVDKANANPTARVENITTVVEAKTVNGAVNISPSMISGLKSVAANVNSTSPAKTNIDIKVNTIAADGKPLSVVVSAEDIKSNAVLTAYAMDPVTGQFIMLNLPNVKCDKNTGLTTKGLVSGLEYHYVPAKTTKAIENSIYNSIKTSDAFAKPVQALPGGVINMSQAISTGFCQANAQKIQYSVSGKSAVIDPVTGLLSLNGNAKKGIITVSIKITLTNGKTKTIKSKIKIS